MGDNCVCLLIISQFYEIDLVANEINLIWKFRTLGILFNNKKKCSYK